MKNEQKEFLNEVKRALGLTWDDMAERAGITPRALKNYRMPDASTEHRTMPSLARKAVEALMTKHDKRGSKKTA